MNNSISYPNSLYRFKVGKDCLPEKANTAVNKMTVEHGW